MPDATGSVTTDAMGALNAVFGDISAYASGSVSRPYSQAGLGSLTAPFAWAADGNSNTPVLIDDKGAAFTATGGVPSAPAQWNAPADYDGGCTASLLPAPPACRRPCARARWVGGAAAGGPHRRRCFGPPAKRYQVRSAIKKRINGSPS